MLSRRFAAHRGFTLVEILVSLVVVGSVFALLIPKILFSMEPSKRKVIAQQASTVVLSAMDEYSRNHAILQSMSMIDLRPYLKVRAPVTTAVDGIPGTSDVDCANGNNGCYKIDNGAVIYWTASNRYLPGIGTNDALVFYVDTDGSYNGSTTGDGKAVGFVLYANGQIRTLGNMLPSTRIGASTVDPDPTLDPQWFSWN